MRSTKMLLILVNQAVIIILVGRNTKFSMLFEAKTDVLLQTSYFIISISERTKGLKIKVIFVKGSQKAHEYNMQLNIMFNFILFNFQHVE